MINYKTLLEKYVTHVAADEGRDFLSAINSMTYVGYISGVHFTKEEYDVLDNLPPNFGDEESQGEEQ